MFTIILASALAGQCADGSCGAGGMSIRSAAQPQFQMSRVDVTCPSCGHHFTISIAPQSAPPRRVAVGETVIVQVGGMQSHGDMMAMRGAGGAGLLGRAFPRLFPILPGRRMSMGAGYGGGMSSGMSMSRSRSGGG